MAATKKEERLGEFKTKNKMLRRKEIEDMILKINASSNKECGFGIQKSIHSHLR